MANTIITNWDKATWRGEVAANHQWQSQEHILHLHFKHLFFLHCAFSEIFTFSFLWKAVSHICTSFWSMLSSRKDLLKRKGVILWLNFVSLWQLIPESENAFISSWILWASMPLNSADPLAKSEDAFCCWPADESPWIDDDLGYAWVAGEGGQTKIYGSTINWHSAYSKRDFCRYLLGIKTMWTEVFLSQRLQLYVS